ncbi:ABC transporter ATP-binding protein [Granulosicoccus antarcticus]|uniref:Ribose import ATP-binding protein RbsA n=1 Tax=Granulosicoccus antarcticus IMCC3135 TaxID=1192854 RepID=A0A2Z2NZS4_9GAMM|nr:ABC transporter ATP-binding protein [Granulosicoccus antarcticus]ASJ76789.1 Ribose import ATP-binding protein RbsA [Granulosicoccus antarcticus IMCC3135]
MSALLQLRGISKAYPAVIANDQIDLDIQRGEIHAILGENGAGKSTLMKLIYGVSQPDEGQILWQGQPVSIRSPSQARSLGIGMVFQHFSLFESLTVAQNIALAVKGSIKSLSAQVEEVGERFGLPLSADTVVHSLSVGERQRVEIIRCILQKPKLLIMDEPTSVLPPQGVQQLFETLRTLREDGCSILYISHKLDEIRQLCDNATILRAGKVVGSTQPASQSNESLARMMIGRTIDPPAHAPAVPDSRIRLSIQNLQHEPIDPFGTTLKKVSLQVSPGEIVGIAGVSGNGQNELMRLISGEVLFAGKDIGDIRFDDTSIKTLPPTKRRLMGLGFVPEERLGRGAVPDLSLAYNALLTAYRHGLTKLGMIRFGAMHRFAQDCIEDNDVRCGGIQSMAGSLSGGNLQKFIVGREMALQPTLLVLSQPTWGLDVGAANNIRTALLKMRDQGAAVLVVSEELEELFEISDRLHVMYDGNLSPSLQTRDTSSTQIGRWMTGEFLHESGAA